MNTQITLLSNKIIFLIMETKPVKFEPLWKRYYGCVQSLSDDELCNLLRNMPESQDMSPLESIEYRIISSTLAQRGICLNS